MSTLVPLALRKCYLDYDVLSWPWLWLPLYPAPDSFCVPFALCSRRNFTSKSNPQSANAVANATEAEAVSVSRNAAAATATKAVQRASNRVYSPTEKFALALWHG
jgi:hypothetical protein